MTKGSHVFRSLMLTGLLAAAAIAVPLAGAQSTPPAGQGPAAPAPEPTTPPAQDQAIGAPRPAITTPATSIGPRGRYTTLLKQFAMPNDRVSYGDFCDYGYYGGTSYAGQTDLPPGYWVYLYPNWYIFQSAPGDVPVKTSFSPLQATGKPDTAQAGDYSTAWASATADGQREWLELTYDATVEAVGVMVYETYNPGAVNRVTAYAGNEQVEVWAGKDPTEVGKQRGVSVIGFKTPVTTNRVRIDIDSPAVAGWNEIDAVGLITADGAVHWATSATASSTWGVATPAADPFSAK